LDSNLIPQAPKSQGYGRSAESSHFKYYYLLPVNKRRPACIAFSAQATFSAYFARSARFTCFRDHCSTPASRASIVLLKIEVTDARWAASAAA
jgi:hypothetical protein